VIYVWWDALANYVTALGFGPDYRRWWLDADRVHVIGKGIVRFHAVHWAALLLSAGRPLPTRIFVHDYLTVDGAKISKSSGPVVDPADLAARYGTDAVRWWLLREAAPLGSTDFTTGRLVTRSNQDLSNALGNLVHRTTTLRARHRAGRTPGAGDDLAAGLPGRIDRALAAFDFRAATEAVIDVVGRANRLVEAERPWDLARPGSARSGSARFDPARFDTVLATLIRTARTVAAELGPFLPAGAARLEAQLRDGAEPTPLFPRLQVGLPTVPGAGDHRLG
jgi:methionyl-tRNA synthetase